MSNLDYIVKNYEEGNEIYIMDDLEDIAVRYAPTKDGYECYAKFKGEAEYKISEHSNVGGEGRHGRYYNDKSGIRTILKHRSGQGC